MDCNIVDGCELFSKIIGGWYQPPTISLLEHTFFWGAEREAILHFARQLK